MTAKTENVTTIVGERRIKLAPSHVEAIQAGVNDPMSLDHTPEMLDATLDRFTIVEDCNVCDEPLIADEVIAHSLTHVTDDVRSVCGMFVDLNVEQQREVYDYIRERMKK